VRVGILGGGRVGSGLADFWTRAGHDVRVSTRDTLQETAEHGDVVVLAVPATAIGDVLDATAPALAGRVLVDATNDLRPEPGGGALEIARRVPAARVVKAFNTVFAGLYGAVARAETPPALVFCGDDAAAKAAVAELIRDAGYEPVDAGPLDRAPDVEAFARLVIRLAYEQGRGRFFYRFTTT
jgi:8-hydroxy-5-deazaflavin:NADPH oxidoreductase